MEHVYLSGWTQPVASSAYANRMDVEITVFRMNSTRGYINPLSLALFRHPLPPLQLTGSPHFADNGQLGIRRRALGR